MPINPNSGPRIINHLLGTSGSVKVVLKSGVTIAGTVDVSTLSTGVVKVTDATPTTWVLALDNIEAVGQ